MLTINIVDLKLRLGIIDPNENRDIINALKKSNIDYDLIGKIADDAAKAKKKDPSADKEAIKKASKYSDFSSFRKNALETAQKELAKKTCIQFDFEPVRAGRGGKVVGVRFFITSKKKTKYVPIVEDVVITDDQKEDIIDQINDLIDFKVKIKDLRAIAEASDYNLSKVEKAYNVLKNVKGGVDNPTGFMIKAIKDGYDVPSGGYSQNSFNNFTQNEYDFDDLEKKLLDN